MNNLKNIEFKNFLNKQKLFKECITIFKKEVKKKNIIVTGGSTYKEFYSKLIKKKINWKNVNLILSDERLTLNKNNQNYSILNKKILDKIKFNKPNIFFNINEYNFKNKKIFLDNLEKDFLLFKKINTAFLAVGDDGHIASIFNTKPKIKSKKKIFFLTKKRNESFYRVSFNMNFFLNLKKIFIILFGKKKKKILKIILRKNFHNNNYPIIRLLKNTKSKVKILYINN